METGWTSVAVTRRRKEAMDRIAARYGKGKEQWAQAMYDVILLDPGLQERINVWIEAHETQGATVEAQLGH